MKKVTKLVLIVFVIAGLVQLMDLSFYFLNQPDTYLFNIGIILFLLIFISFCYLGIYTMDILKPKEKEEKSTKKEKS